MEIGGIAANAAGAVSGGSNDQGGIGGLTSDSFMKLLIAQLKNQDPLEPVKNEQLLNQIAMMRNIQSDVELSEGLESITQNQQLTTGASFIGKSIIGKGKNDQPVSGLVDRAFVRDGETFVGIGETELPLDRVTGVKLTNPGNF